jgi:prevent-host-death family protein
MGYPAKKETHTMAAGEFKAHCLALMDRVDRTGEEIIITKHRKAIARLVPATHHATRPFVGRTTGSLQVIGDLIAPIHADWEPGDDY